jgi:hypothetical protein
VGLHGRCGLRHYPPAHHLGLRCDALTFLVLEALTTFYGSEVRHQGNRRPERVGLPSFLHHARIQNCSSPTLATATLRVKAGVRAYTSELREDIIDRPVSTDM